MCHANLPTIHGATLANQPCSVMFMKRLLLIGGFGFPLCPLSEHRVLVRLSRRMGPRTCGGVRSPWRCSDYPARGVAGGKTDTLRTALEFEVDNGLLDAHYWFQ